MMCFHTTNPVHYVPEKSCNIRLSDYTSLIIFLAVLMIKLRFSK